jgi:solute carrier family 4 (sodium borate transporter), member 11
MLLSLAFGFLLFILIFMEQIISSAAVNHPSLNLKKGPAYHWDLFIVSLITLVLSIFGLPWVHAVLPYSALHVRAMADNEQVYSPVLGRPTEK